MAFRASWGGGSGQPPGRAIAAPGVVLRCPAGHGPRARVDDQPWHPRAEPGVFGAAPPDRRSPPPTPDIARRNEPDGIPGELGGMFGLPAPPTGGPRSRDE